MAQGKQLPNIENPESLDRVDLQLVEHMRDTEDWTYRSAAKHAGVSVETAFRRICRIRKSDFITSVREDLQRLAPKLSSALEAGLDANEDSNRASVALRLASGLGVLVDKQERKLSLAEATPEQLADAIAKLSDDDLRGVIERRRSARSGS